MAKRASKKKTTRKAQRKTAKKSTAAGKRSARSPAAKKSTRRSASSAASPRRRKGAGRTASKAKPKRAAKASAKKASVARRAASPSKPAGPKPPKSPLSKKELEAFRQLLLAKRATLAGDVTNMTDEALRKNGQNGAGDLSNMPIHMADLGSDNFEQEFTLGLIESESALLREIDEALQRIEDRTYGICLGTGKPIGKARLKAQPWAKYCIDYARRLERGF